MGQQWFRGDATKAENKADAILMAHVRANMHSLGIDLNAAIKDFPTFIDMVERGALPAAKKRFPAKS